MKKSRVTLKVLLWYNLNLTQKQATIFNVWVFQNLITTRKIYCYIAKGTKLLDFQVSFVIELEDLNFQCSGNQTTLHFGVFFFHADPVVTKHTWFGNSMKHF